MPERRALGPIVVAERASVNARPATIILARLFLGLLIAVAVCSPVATMAVTPEGPAPPVRVATPRYLVFQLFTYTYAPDGKAQPFDKKWITQTLDEILSAVGGERGDGVNRQLGFAVGPLSFDHTDDQLREAIRESFKIAAEKGVAVVFHLDDSMFWKRRKELWSHHDNIEWSDWNRTPNTSRRLDWGDPVKLAPQMCFNSKAIQAEVGRVAREVIGTEIKRGIDQLKNIRREVLFGGVIAGWESQIGRDFDSNKPLGYCALTNRGFSKKNPPKDLDAEREAAVKDFVALWARGLIAGGVPREKVYAHTAFVPQKTFAELRKSDPKFTSLTYAEYVNFSTTSVAFGELYTPGFSTYPAPGLFEEIYEELGRHGNPPWASAEGTNLVIGGRPGESGLSMEGYLAKMFNHGATLVNLYAWGVGGQAGKRNPFRIATEDREAIAAYRKFLRGETLQEATVATIVSPDTLAIKIHRVQKELPLWLRKTGDASRIEPLLKKLDQAVKDQRITEAARAADEILTIIHER